MSGEPEHILEYQLLTKLDKVMPKKGFTIPPQCMPEQYRQSDTVEAYRAYYNFEKRHIHKWTKREEPFWLVKI